MELNLAVLIDFDNIAKGTVEDGLGDFDARVIMRRLKDKGRILVARAYCDWDRWPKRHRMALLEQGVTMVELTSHAGSNKNRGDIALAVDAMEMAYTRDYIDAYVVVSGDSDFTPLVMRLKELNRRVIGIGTRRATSRLIANLCDEFLFYDTLLAPANTASEEAGEPLSRDSAFALLVETIINHQRDEAGPIPSGVVKQAMKRKVPAFSEADLGFSSFGRFLEKAEEKKRIVLLRDERGGGFRVDLPNAHTEPVTIAVARPVESEDEEHDPVRAALSAAGLEIASPKDRRIVARAFVELCQERAAKGRKCAVQFVIGDLLNLNLPVRAEDVRGFVNSLFRANILLHVDGEPVRKHTSPFVAPESPDALVDALEARAREVLAEANLLDAAADLFNAEAEPVRRRAPRDEEPAGGDEIGEDGRRKRRRRGGRRGRGGLEAGPIVIPDGLDEEARRQAEEAAAWAEYERSRSVEDSEPVYAAPPLEAIEPDAGVAEERAPFTEPEPVIEPEPVDAVEEVPQLVPRAPRRRRAPAAAPIDLSTPEPAADKPRRTRKPKA